MAYHQALIQDGHFLKFLTQRSSKSTHWIHHSKLSPKRPAIPLPTNRPVHHCRVCKIETDILA